MFININTQVMNMDKVHERRLILERNPKMVSGVSASDLFKWDVEQKKGHTQWQICMSGWGWHGLTNPSKLSDSYAPANWVSVLKCWILKVWGSWRTKITGRRSVWGSRINSDTILGITRNTWMRMNIKTPSGVYKTV